MGNVIGLFPSRTGIAIGRLVNAQLLNRMKISNFFLLLKYIFFSIYYCPSEATEDTCMFPGRQIKYNLP